MAASTLKAPNLVYPIGGENLRTPTVVIQWTVAPDTDSLDRPVYYELFYTTSYSHESEPSWIQIATVPADVRQFVWSVPSSLKTQTARIAIRARNSQGTRSTFSISSSNVSINRIVLPIPQLASPSKGKRYDSVISISVVDPSTVKRAYYHFSYSSESAGIPKTTIADRVPATVLPFQWMIADLPAADDYVLYASTVDASGNSSESAAIRGIRVVHEGFFLFDTNPPEAHIDIEGNKIFTRFRETGVNIYAYDEATGVHAMQLKELGEEEVSGAPLTARNSATYSLSPEDGKKVISLLVQDFGGNRNLLGEGEARNIFHNAMSLPETSTVVDFAVRDVSGSRTLFVVTKGDAYELYEIVTYPRRLQVIEDEPTALAVYDLTLYVATRDEDYTGSVSARGVNGLVSIHAFSQMDEWVTSMAATTSSLFFGTNTGRLFKYDGTEVTELAAPADNSPIRSLWSDNSNLYLSYDNGDDYSIMIYSNDGDSYQTVSI